MKLTNQGTLKESSTGEKRPRTAPDDEKWDGSDDESITRPVKRRCSAGDVFRSKDNAEVYFKMF